MIQSRVQCNSFECPHFYNHLFLFYFSFSKLQITFSEFYFLCCRPIHPYSTLLPVPGNEYNVRDARCDTIEVLNRIFFQEFQKIDLDKVEKANMCSVRLHDRFLIECLEHCSTCRRLFLHRKCQYFNNQLIAVIFPVPLYHVSN